MRFFTSVALAALSVSSAVHAASWTFEDATLTVQGKGAGVGGGVKEKYDNHHTYGTQSRS